MEHRPPCRRVDLGAGENPIPADDPDLTWQAPPGPDLPYDGVVPEQVRRLAAERRAQYREQRR